MTMIPLNIIERMINAGCCKITIEGNSMEPTLFENDTVEIMSADSVEINDVVLFCLDNKYVLHRVVDIFGDLIITKGDNNTFMDHPISKSRIIGKLKNNSKTIFTMPEFKVVYNIWEGDYYDQVKSYANDFKLDIIYCPGKLFEDGMNIAMTPYSTSSINDIEFSYAIETQKLYVHVGAKLSDFECEGYWSYKDFDAVYHSGVIMSNFILKKKDIFLITINEIERISRKLNG